MKKKVLLYIDRWGTGGIESLLVNIIDKINKENFETNILVSQKESNVYDLVLKKNNCVINEILKKQNKNPVLRILKTLIKLKKILKESNVEIIHINVYNSIGLIYAWIAKKAGIKKIIVHAHNTGIDKDKLRVKHLVHNVCKKIFVKKYYIYLACSNEAAQFCFGNIKTTIIHNGIDTKKFIYNEKVRNTYREKFNLDEKMIIGNVGRFVEQKNHSFLIDIFNEILKINKDCALVLIGKGPLKEDVKRKVKKYGIDKNVIFLQERNDINCLMQMMDAFCLPSLYEGLGIVLIEAQTSGLPCIISNGVPNEAIVTDNVIKIDLKEEPRKWAKIIIEKVEEQNRKSEEKNVTINGYNILENIKELEKIYNA